MSPSDTRSRILDAFADELLANGYPGVSLDRIARSVAIRKASLYHHFPGGKEEMYTEVAMRYIAESERVLQTALATGGGLAEQLTAVVTLFARGDGPSTAMGQRLFDATRQVGDGTRSAVSHRYVAALITPVTELMAAAVARHVGATSHLAAVLIAALERYPFEIILVPMNIVERQPLEALIPLCRQRGVGVSIMKPLATGLLPAPLALKWLINQPIDVAVPGMTTLEEVEEDTAVGALDVLALTGDEARAVADLQASLEHVRCRICSACDPVCPQGIPIAVTLGTDVMYDHYRTMGAERFASFSWSRDAITGDLPHREERIAAIASCTRCGACEEACEFGLPVMDLLAEMLPGMRDMVRIYRELL